MIKDETENLRHLPRVSMRNNWFTRRVHPEGLEPSTNGLRDHCYDVLTPDIIGLIVSSLEVCPRFLCPIFDKSNLILSNNFYTNQHQSTLQLIVFIIKN